MVGVIRETEGGKLMALWHHIKDELLASKNRE
jgi:hypothetical protein